MTALLALGLLTVAPRVVEVPMSDTDKVVVQVFVPAPPNMSDREQAGWEVLADALYDGTEEFSRDRLIQYGSQEGTPLLIEAMPDYIRIQIIEPKKGLKVGSQIAEALCRRATLTADAVAESVKRLKARRLDAWQEALFDLELPYASVTAEVVRGLYGNAFRADNMTFVYGGDFESGQGKAEIASRFGVAESKPTARSRFDRLPRQRVRHWGNVSTYELRGSPVSLTKADGGADLLAVFAVGVGKESAMHRVLRNQLGWSYRQEAVLWPTLEGWRPRFLFARVSTDITLGGAARDALLKDVDAWTEADLDRAKAMAFSSFGGDNPLSPVWCGPSGAIGVELEDRCTWSGLTTMMFGTAIATDTVVSILKPVTLAELKAAGVKLLDGANVSVIPASG